jgi:hypothetical protein
VYLLLDVEGQILYVGKAKDLPERLSYYLRPGNWATEKIRVLGETTADFRVIQTASEQEALDLETRLIIELRPPYNGSVQISPRARSPDEPTLRQQAIDHIRDLIRRGELKPGERLPKYKLLADELGMSPSTVEWAYWGLQAEGLASRIPFVAWVVTQDALQRVNDNQNLDI